jgi:hemerythrin-like domain-containing protein
MQSIALISQDHETLRQALDILDLMVRWMEEGARIEISDARKIVEFLIHFGDEYHQTLEEEVFYPALLYAAPRESVLHDMLSEHNRERALVAGIQNALKNRKGMDFANHARELSSVLRGHMEKEDEFLLQAAERWLSHAEDDRVVAAWRRHHPPVETNVDFSRLERRYTGKPRGHPSTEEAGDPRPSLSGVPFRG